MFMFPAIDENGPIGEGMDIGLMIVEDPLFQSTLERINEVLTDAFDEVRPCCSLLCGLQGQLLGLTWSHD